MALLTRLVASVFGGKENETVRQLAEEIVCRCHADVRNCVGRRPRLMSPAVLRGYVRAYAAGLVAAEAETAAAEGGWSPPLREKVVRQSTEQLVEMVVQDLLNGDAVCQSRAAAA